MKKFFTALASLLVVVPLLVFLFALLVVTLVFSCSLAGGVYSSVGVLVACSVATVAIALIVWRVCLANSLQALQLLRENTAALVIVVVSMIAISSVCSLVGFGSIGVGAAGFGRLILMLVSLIEVVLCCMMAKRTVGYLSQSGASVGQMRLAVQTLLLISAGLSVLEFFVAMFEVGVLGMPIAQTLFEDLAFTYGDVVWLELILVCIKFTASISGVVLTYRRRNRQSAKEPVKTYDLTAQKSSDASACDATAELDKEAINKALAA